jgi:ADP-ribose pyrophosphatase
MEEKHAEIVKKNLIRHGSILDMYDLEMELPDGSHEHWDFVSHRKGAACVVAVFPDGRLLLVRQYRPALGRYTWELPAGARDSVNESTKVCAERELREETGYDSDELVQLLSLKATVAYDDELIDVYLARNIRKIGAQQLDPAESINMKAFTLDEVLQAIKDLKIQDAKTVAGILAYKAYYVD